MPRRNRRQDRALAAARRLGNKVFRSPPPRSPAPSPTASHRAIRVGTRGPSEPAPRRAAPRRRPTAAFAPDRARARPSALHRATESAWSRARRTARSPLFGRTQAAADPCSLLPPASRAALGGRLRHSIRCPPEPPKRVAPVELERSVCLLSPGARAVRVPSHRFPWLARVVWPVPWVREQRRARRRGGGGRLKRALQLAPHRANATLVAQASVSWPSDSSVARNGPPARRLGAMTAVTAVTRPAAT